MARRDATDPREQGIAPNWAWAWPANRRILYNRASADPSGKPWNPAKPIIEWNGSQVGRHRRARLCADRRRRPTMSARSSCRRKAWGACSRATRWWKARSPSITSRSRSPSENVLHPKVRNNPAARVYRRRPGGLRDRGRIPLCRHDLSPDRAFPLLDQARADQRDPPAGGIRRDRRGAGEGEGHRAGRLGALSLQARRDRLQGLCHQAHQADDGRRQADACRSACRCIGASPARRARATAPTR